jgi:hypothetical protein
MRTKKTYRSLHALELTLCVNVGGRDIYCEFTGGVNQPQRLNGSYSTSSLAIQTALEKHPRFKNAFDITKIVNIDSPNEGQAKIMGPEGDLIANVPLGSIIVDAEPPKEEPIIKNTETDQYVSQVTNGQQAKDELNKTFGVPWSRLKNLTQTRSEAAKLNIVYPNWKITA